MGRKVNQPDEGPQDSRVPLLEAIATRMGELRRSERKVAEAVLASPGDVVHLSMAALAERAGVSEPTVMRFCTAMGARGFQAFKLELAQTVALGLPATHSAIEPGESVPTLIGKVFDQSISSLDRARRALETERIEEAVELLARAGEIVFAGFGASSIVAQDAQQKFPLFGVPCSAPVDAHQQFIAASMAGPGTVFVALSNTGRTQSVLDVAAVAQEQGARVIGITGEQSPLAELADVPLVVKTFEDTDFYTPTLSRLAALVVIDVLATGVALRRPPEHLARLQRMKEELTAMRTGARKAVSPRVE
ncbi:MULTISPECIES: SIS domain-containing protein [Amycolatopsis]|uniref:SIS domain-containing protein n=1 Tax=Amycolatopsis dongchuanensis TaxID=1070866 RepID=A0ABP9RAB6_9PSEU